MRPSGVKRSGAGGLAGPEAAGAEMGVAGLLHNNPVATRILGLVKRFVCHLDRALLTARSPRQDNRDTNTNAEMVTYSGFAVRNLHCQDRITKFFGIRAGLFIALGKVFIVVRYRQRQNELFPTEAGCEVHRSLRMRCYHVRNCLQCGVATLMAVAGRCMP